MNDARYIYKTVPISIGEAMDERNRQIDDLKLRIAEIQEDIDFIVESGLPTSRIVQIELHPGDEGYEDAPIGFTPAQYQGNVTWQNIENSTPPKPE